MNTKVFYYLKKFKEAHDSEIPDLLIEAMKALPEYIVGYDIEEKQAYIKRDLRKVLTSKIKASGLSQAQVADLLGINYSSLKDFTRGQRGMNYDNLCKLLALFDEPCIGVGEINEFLKWARNVVMYDDKGFFDIKSGENLSASKMVETFKATK